MALITWTYRPADQVTPGEVRLGWSLAQPDTEVRWYLEPLAQDFPGEYVLGATEAAFIVTDPGLYVFHLEAKAPDGTAEERVVLFEVTPAGESQPAQPELRLTTLPERRSLPPLRTEPRSVPFRGVPDSHEENTWARDVIEDLWVLHDASAQLQREIDLHVKVGLLEQIASKHVARSEALAWIARQPSVKTRSMEIRAEQFTPGLPAGLEDAEAAAVVDPVWGEIAPSLLSEPENKLGWPTAQGLELPASLRIETFPAQGAFVETDPKWAVDGRLETAWVREIQVRPGETPQDVVYRLTIPSGITAQRVANRLDLACLPAYGVDVRYVKLFDGTSWKLVYGWPQAQTGSGPVPLPVSQAGVLRLRFPDQTVAGIEVALRPMRGLISQGASEYIAGLYHLGLWYDPFQWGVAAQAHAVLQPAMFPSGGVRVLAAVPVTSNGRPAEHVQPLLYRITPAGAWIPMDPGEALLGEGLGIVLELRPEADRGWAQTLGGVRIDVESL